MRWHRARVAACAAGLVLGAAFWHRASYAYYEQRLAVAGHCVAHWYGTQTDSNGDTWSPLGGLFWSDWGVGGGNPVAGQIIDDGQGGTNVWCGVPDTSDNPKWNMTGWNVQGYNTPDSFADFAEACVKFWNGTGWSCTAEIPLPNYSYAYNIMGDPNYTSNPVWTSSSNQNNFAFLYVVLGPHSQYFGDYYWDN